MKRKSLILSLIILAAVVLSACNGGSPATPGQEVTVDGGSYRNITPAELDKMLGDKDFTLVNVHIPYAGELAGTDLSVSYLEVEQNISLFPQDKGAKIVLTCLTGPMGVDAAETLVGLGYTNVFNLDEGMREWERQGYQIINKPQTTAEPGQNGM
jgi:rhodanese-related sulfurtransferase